MKNKNYFMQTQQQQTQPRLSPIYIRAHLLLLSVHAAAAAAAVEKSMNENSRSKFSSSYFPRDYIRCVMIVVVGGGVEAG